MPIYCKLDKLLKDRDMTYQALSKKVKVSYVALWKLASNKGFASRTLIEKICKVLKCDVGDLFSLRKK